MRSTVKLTFILAASILLVPTTAFSADRNFDDGAVGNSNWSNNVNWSANAIPGAADDARFEDGVTPNNITSTMDLPGHTIRDLEWRMRNANAHTINMLGNTLNVGRHLHVNNNFTETAGSVGVVTGGGTLNVGTGGGNKQFFVGRRSSNIGSSNTSQVVRGSLDLSGLTNLNATLGGGGDFFVGVRTDGRGQVTGTLIMATNNTIDANDFWVSDSAQEGLTGVPSFVTFGSGSNVLDVDQIRIGGRKGSATVDIAAGGSLTISGQGSSNADLFVGYNQQNTGSRAFGELDLSGGSTLNAQLDEFRIGRKAAGGSGKGVGRVTLADTNVIDARVIEIGRSDNGGQTGAGDQSRLILGNSNTINVDTFNIGERKSNVLVEFAAPGGTLNLTGDANARTDLRIGRNNVNTGTNAVSIVDLSGGTFNAQLDELRIGQHQQGSGSGKGTLIFDAGSVNANTAILGQPSTGGNGSSNPNNTTGTLTMNGGSFTVNNDFQVGLDGGLGFFTANGGTVNIGVGDQSGDDFNIGRNNDAGVTGAAGTVDLSGASQVNIDVGNLRIGTLPSGANPGSNAMGSLTLSNAGPNNVEAGTITVGDSPGSGNTSVTSTLAFGATTNTVDSNTIYVARRKSVANATLVPGGTIDLTGDSNARADLRIGYNDANTGANSVGTMDTTAGVFNAQIDELTLGRHNAGNGSGKGTLSVAGGVRNINSVTLGHASASGTSNNPQNTTGTLNHSGGTTTVNNNMTLGNGGTGTVNLSGGTLSFDDTSGTTQAPNGPVSTLFVNAGSAFNFSAGTFENVTTIDVALSNSPFTVGDGIGADSRFVIGHDGVSSPAGAQRAITTIQDVGGGSNPIDFYLNDDGTLAIDIFGPVAAGGNGEAASIGGLDPLDPIMDSDLLHVTGDALLDGTLAINLNGFEPGPFHWYDVLLADGEINIDEATFDVDGVNLFRVIDNPFGSGQLLQVAVPEPSSLLLWSVLGLGLAGFGYRRFRGKK